jgi:hypothetical protein
LLTFDLLGNELIPSKVSCGEGWCMLSQVWGNEQKLLGCLFHCCACKEQASSVAILGRQGEERLSTGTLLRAFMYHFPSVAGTERPL